MTEQEALDETIQKLRQVIREHAVSQPSAVAKPLPPPEPWRPSVDDDFWIPDAS